MKTIRNMHGVIFPNIYILLDIIYHILLLTIIIALVIIAVDLNGQTNAL